MRLVLACILLFIAPAGALLVTDRYVGALEDEFLQDATRQVARLQSIIDLYPPKVRTFRAAPAIAQLRGIGDGGTVAAVVCSSNAAYHNLFDHLTTRCDRWLLLRRARKSALLAVVLSLGVFALVLTSRITVRRYASSQLWPGNWTLWFLARGIAVLLLIQVGVSLIGYGIVLRTLMSKAFFVFGILSVLFVILFWAERKAVLAFIEPESLNRFRPHGVKGRRRQDRFAV